MLFVGLLLTAFLAWHDGGNTLIAKLDQQPMITHLLLFFLVVMAVLGPVLEIQPLTLPSDKLTQKALYKIIEKIKESRTRGDVLFMDQRQLLTFGYVKNVPLVPEYEKKIMMDYAMMEDGAYFDQFYNDLKRHRFSLIISDPLKEISVYDEEGNVSFKQENDFWVKWVAEPVLRYYIPIEQFRGMGVQILEPRTE
jgi:hypothetical protein